VIDRPKKILYEDDYILAIDKPDGLVVHPDGKTVEPSVSDWFAKKYPQSRDVGEKLGEIERSGIVHRIDRETSGVLLVAKTNESHAWLKKQFQERTIEKVYHLFVYGLIKDDEGVIDLAIARSASDFRKWSAERGARGERREAITHFQVLKRSDETDTTFLEAKPKTGRTHQIRVHFKAIHHPIVCDKLYAPKKHSVLGFERLALHARSITFKNLAGENILVEAPYPKDFQNALDNLDSKPDS
jgi:23S rRNA pseudouridine1911/1915/1917 synthase